MPIKEGDVVTFKPEHRDPGDESITFRALDDENRGRFMVVAELGLSVNPTHVVRVEWVATVNGQEI